MKKSKTSSQPMPVIKESVTVSPRSNNLVFVLLIVVSLFSLYLFFKIRNLEQKVASGGQGQQAAATSPLSVDNLKKYAKDVGADTGKFNKCLDNNVKKAVVTADTSYGASVGVQGTPGFYINGKFLGGAFPFEYFKEIIDKELNGNSTNDCSSYSEALQKYCEVRQNYVFSDPKYAFDPSPQKIDTGNSPFEGVKNPKVTIVEFSDFECPYCARVYPTVKKIMETYKNDARLYFKQYPLPFHKFAQKAAEASLCVLDQGNDKFWKFHDKLFTLESQAAVS